MRHLEVRFLSVSLVLMTTVGTVTAQTLTVARVVDGDTFELSDGRTVRLIGVDAPEVHPSAKRQRDIERSEHDRQTLEALGHRAGTYAATQVAGGRIALELDPTNAAIGHRDRYGRVLAYVWILDEFGKELFCVNERLIADGYVYAYTKYPFMHMGDYLELQRSARSGERGLWDPEMPIEPFKDRDCGDFSTQAEAQRFFIAQGGPEYDPHRLDGDGNGRACERLP